MGQNSRAILNTVRGQSVVYTLYPVVGAGVVAGATVTSGAAAWGADKEIIAAAAIAADFWVCAADIDVAEVVQGYVVELEIAGVTSIFSFRFTGITITAVGTYALASRFGVPVPRFIPGGSQITARASGTAAKTINVSVLVATGL